MNVDHYAAAHPWAGPTLGQRPVLLAALAHVKAAAAEANVSSGQLDAGAGRALVGAATTLEAAQFDATPLLLGGGAVAVNVAVNVALNQSPVAEGANRSQSTADVCHTTGRIAVVASIVGLGDNLDTLSHALDSAAHRWSAAAPVTLARTCLRDAVAVPIALWPDGAARALDRAHARLVEAAAPLHRITLGSTVVGTGSGATDAYRAAVVPALAARTGLMLTPHPHPASALQHSDDLLAVSGALADLATRVIRIGHDLRLLTSGPAGGFGELTLDADGDGSSFFAGKINPIDAETAIQLGCQAIGLHAGTAALAQQGELHLNVYDLPMALNVVDQITLLDAACNALAHTVASTEANPRRCAELALTAHPTKETSP